MSRVNKSQYAILGLLSKRPMSGYDMKRLLDRMSGFYWSESNAQLYPVLKKLAQENKVTSALDPASGARNRIIYTITNAGLDFLKEWLLQPVDRACYREEMILKVSLGHNINKKELMRHLKDYSDDLQAQKKQRDKVQRHIETDHVGRDDQLYLMMTYDFSEKVIDAKLAWCEETLKKLETA